MKSNNYLHYKDYVGSVEFSEKDATFKGEIVGIRDSVYFQGDCVHALTEGFRNAVDDYLYFCNLHGKKPEKPFKGSFNVRIGAELHRKAALEASAKGISLNAYVEAAIRAMVSDCEL